MLIIGLFYFILSLERIKGVRYMSYDHIFDSSNHTYEVEFKIDRENDKPLTVLFEKENIVLVADSHGNATFMSTDNTIIKEDKALSDRFFSRIYCVVNNNKISVRFPVIETIDHYPDCDGEYDRYSERIIDSIIITCPVNK